MTTGEMIAEIAGRKGWTDGTLLDALTGYLANQQSDVALRDYLEQRPDLPLPGDREYGAARYVAHHGIPTLMQTGAGNVARHDGAMPAEIDGMPVRAAFPTPPGDEAGMESWTVILRETAGPRGSRYRLCRARRAGAPGDWEVTDGMPGAQDLTWTLAAIWFARGVQAGADGREPPQRVRPLPR
jgi:hypothetical protein